MQNRRKVNIYSRILTINVSTIGFLLLMYLGLVLLWLFCWLSMRYSLIFWDET